MPSRKIVLPLFELTATCNSSDPKAQSNIIEVNGSTTEYFTKPYPTFATYHSMPYSWSRFPVIVNADGSLWEDASLFLLEKIKHDGSPNMDTASGIADALQDFKRFVDDQGLDYKGFPKLRFQRPTYAYSRELKKRVDADEIKVSTANGRLSGVIQFYRWLMIEGFEPENEPWIEDKVYSSFKGATGSVFRMDATRTDLKLRASNVKPPHRQSNKANGELEAVIQDGGQLVPLDKDEQDALVESINELGNPECRLMVLIALVTGARIQTVQTLRVGQFQGRLAEGETHMMRVGAGTLTNVKKNDAHYLLFPDWLYNALQTYSKSDRAKSRRAKSAYDHDDPNQYLFLTRVGNPYYVAIQDESNLEQPNKSFNSKGCPVRQWMRRYLKPLMRSKLGNPRFNFKFHDLRATCGANELEAVLEQTGDEMEALKAVQRLLGHKSIQTTIGYLRYHKRLLDRRREAKRQHTLWMENLRTRAMGGA